MKPTTESLQPALSGKLAYRVVEAARVLGISQSAVYELVRAGTLPHKRLGRRIVIPARFLEDWINTPDNW
ncbi:MAG: helix-turn-helix domain-containing protein [Meiothermus sp.]|nr:helix-turn-helix domain-containing protein [Meiothermus sp.]